MQNCCANKVPRRAASALDKRRVNKIARRLQSTADDKRAIAGRYAALLLIGAMANSRDTKPWALFRLIIFIGVHKQRVDQGMGLGCQWSLLSAVLYPARRSLRPQGNAGFRPWITLFG